MPRPPKWTQEKLAKAQELRAHGLSFRTIGDAVGASGALVSLWLNPAIRERVRLYNKAQRATEKERLEAKRKAEDELLSQVPIDDRTAGERLLGTPLRGRSALDKRIYNWGTGKWIGPPKIQSS